MTFKEVRVLTEESTFIALMRNLANDPAARGLSDDAAVVAIGDQAIVLTHDSMVENVHWLPDADPADVAWKLVSTNISDLAAKGAKPVGVLLGYMLGNDEWDRRFAAGMAEALSAYDVALLGGDTVAAVNRAETRCIGMTALGIATCDPVPSRSGAKAGDVLYVTGTLGDAKTGFDLAVNGQSAPQTLLNAFNRPTALVREGMLLAPLVNAMMDVSDGVLLDASRMAAASGLRVEIDLAAIPLSADYIALYADDKASRMIAASWGDDYQLLFAGPSDVIWPVAVTVIGKFLEGEGLSLIDQGTAVALPDKLGFEHR